MKKKKKISERIDAGVKKAIQKTIEEHIKEGRPYVVSENGEVVWVYPDGSKKFVDKQEAE